MPQCPYPACYMPLLDWALARSASELTLSPYLAELLEEWGKRFQGWNLAIVADGPILLAGPIPPEGFWDRLLEGGPWEGDGRFCLPLDLAGNGTAWLIGWGGLTPLHHADRDAAHLIGRLGAFAIRHTARVSHLEQRSAYFATLFDQGRDAVFVHRVFQGRLVMLLEANAQGLAMLGRTMDDLRGISLMAVFPPAKVNEVKAQLRTAWDRGETRFEIALVHKKGEVIPVEIRAHRLRHRDEELLVTIARDLRELRALERQLQLAQKMEDLGRLAGGVAHDFNNLLTVIQSYTEFVQGELSLDDPLREDLDEVLRACTGAGRLTQQLLQFSRRQPEAPVWIEVAPLIEGTARMLRRVLGDHAHLSLDLRDDVGRLFLDPGHFEQILVNLVVNARDAMPDGGQIVLRALGNEASVHLEVEDSGIGMSPEVHARIFEPFFTTKEGRGTGLGLATVFRLVQQYEGEIRVRSEVGKGSQFSLIFPRRMGGSVPCEAMPPEAPLVGLARRVLLVEDQGPVRRMVARILRQGGYQVVSAQGPGEALLITEKGEPFDAVLTDVAMPLMSGPELAQRLHARFPDIPVLYMSGYSGLALGRFGLQGEEVLPKPVRASTLLAALARRLG